MLVEFHHSKLNGMQPLLLLLVTHVFVYSPAVPVSITRTKAMKFLLSTETALRLLSAPQVVIECAASVLKAEHTVPLSVQSSAYKCGKHSASYKP